MKPECFCCGSVEVVYFTIMDFVSFPNVAKFMDNLKILFHRGSIMMCFESNILLDVW